RRIRLPATAQPLHPPRRERQLPETGKLRAQNFRKGERGQSSAAEHSPAGRRHAPSIRKEKDQVRRDRQERSTSNCCGLGRSVGEVSAKCVATGAPNPP